MKLRRLTGHRRVAVELVAHRRCHHTLLAGVRQGRNTCFQNIDRTSCGTTANRVFDLDRTRLVLKIRLTQTAIGGDTIANWLEHRGRRHVVTEIDSHLFCDE